jgi:hypothetical protein
MAALCDKCNPWLRLKNDDPPLKWLLKELRRTAKEDFDAGTLLSATTSQEHICALAADLIENAATQALTPVTSTDWSETAKRAKAAADKVTEDARVDPTDLKKVYRGSVTHTDGPEK